MKRVVKEKKNWIILLAVVLLLAAGAFTIGVMLPNVEAKDLEKPVIALNGDLAIEIPKGGQYTESGYSVTDNSDQEIAKKVRVTNCINTNRLGTYTVKYEVRDNAGNYAVATRTVIITDAQLPGNGNTIYLTFDDGPSSDITPQILDVLKSEGVKATFFVEGIYGDDYSEYMKRIVAEGHTIGIHCYTHDYATVYASPEAYFSDLTSAVAKVREITGVESKIIRFPGGGSNQVSRKYTPGIMSYLSQEVQNRGYHYFYWNVASGDTGAITSEDVYNNLVNNLGNQGTCVALLHDRSNNDKIVEPVRQFIRYAKANGYKFDKITMETPQVHHGISN